MMLTRPVQTYFRWIMVNLIEMSAARHRCANCRNVSFGHVWPCLAHAPGSGFLFHSGRCVSHLPLQLLWHRGAAAHARLMLDHFGCPNCWQLERVCTYLQYLTVSYSILETKEGMNWETSKDEQGSTNQTSTKIQFRKGHLLGTPRQGGVHYCYSNLFHYVLALNSVLVQLCVQFFVCVIRIFFTRFYLMSR